MTRILSLLFILFPALALASSKISYLNVDGNNVHFALAGDKAHTIPSCAVAETNQHYGVSLLTEAGRAMYSLLITAMSSKQAVSVVSGNDCNDVNGVERAQSVSLTPDASAAGGSGKAMYLYKGDGITKLGRVFNTNDSFNIFFYFPVEDNTLLRTYNNTNWTSGYKANYRLHFKQTGCQGDAYIRFTGNLSSTPYYVTNDSFNNGELLKRVSSSRFGPKSVLYTNGSCSDFAESYEKHYLAVPAPNELCGNSPCIFKEE
ncbi:hypothetical protein [Thalassotalea ganghwensis]